MKTTVLTCTLRSLVMIATIIMVTIGMMLHGMDSHTSQRKMDQHISTSLTVVVVTGNWIIVNKMVPKTTGMVVT